MPPKGPPFASVTGVLDALRLLLGHRGEAPDYDVVVRARLTGLVFATTGDFWKADGPAVLRLLKRSLHRLSIGEAALNLEIRGLGEMKARCHADLAQPLIDYFRPHHRRRTLVLILSAIGKTQPPKRERFYVSTAAAAQFITTGALDWATFQAAYLRGGRTFDIDIGRNYGLSMLFEIILTVDPTLLNDWIAVRPNDLSLAIIARVAFRKLTFAANTMLASALLGSSNRTLQCLAAAAIVMPAFEQGSNRTVRQCWQLLVNGGIDPGDAIWMTGARLKEAIHARYRAESHIQQQTDRLCFLHRKPDAAMGGIWNAAAEARSCEQQIEDTSRSLAALLQTIETTLTELAECWPEAGLSDIQMGFLENIFVSTPEFRLRLAEKLSHIGDRRTLLEANIRQLETYLGLIKADSAFDEYFLPDTKTAHRIILWAARSAILLYENARRGIGWETSILVMHLTRAAAELLDEPFAAARRPTRWQSATARTACAVSFAMTVVEQMPPGRRTEVQTLSELALDHAYRILTSQAGYASLPIDQMVRDAVYQLGLYASFKNLRVKWIETGILPPFARALAIWTSPDEVRARRGLASQLFRDVAQLPLGWRQLDQQLGRLFTLLDVALGSCHQAGARDLIARLIELWDETFEPWMEITGGRWRDAAPMIAAALEGPGPARDAFLADPTFAQTACRLIIGSAPVGETHATFSTI
jgi:hypothetical protein